jgi:hypothetical protein
VIFNDVTVADRVLHSQNLWADGFSLVIRWWRWQSHVLFSPLWYKVLLAIDNLSAHVWSPEIVQMIIDSSCLSFEIAPTSLNREDLSHFFMVAWAIHPNLIPMEVGCMVPESKGEPIVGLWPLFLRVDEIVHS